MICKQEPPGCFEGQPGSDLIFGGLLLFGIHDFTHKQQMIA